MFFTQVFDRVLINMLNEVLPFSLEKPTFIEKLQNVKVFG